MFFGMVRRAFSPAGVDRQLTKQAVFGSVRQPPSIILCGNKEVKA